MRQLALVYALLASSVNGLGCAATRPELAGQRPTSLCVLAADAASYGGQLLVVSGYFRAGGEQDVLYDPSCDDGKPLMYVVFKPRVLQNEQRVRRTLSSRAEQVHVVLKGVVSGPRKMPIDEKLPEVVKEGLKDEVQRYGHMNSLPMMIEVERVLDARKLGGNRVSSVNDSGWLPATLRRA